MCFRPNPWHLPSRKKSMASMAHHGEETDDKQWEIQSVGEESVMGDQRGFNAGKER